MRLFKPRPTQRSGAAGKNPNERGQSLVEMALAMIFLVWLIAVIIDMGSALFTWIALRDAAQEGALYGSINPGDSATIKLRVVTSSDRPLDMVEAINATPPSLQILIPPPIDVDSNGCIGTGDAITVTVVYFYTPLIPLVTSILPTGRIAIRATVTDTILLPEC